MKAIIINCIIGIICFATAFYMFAYHLRLTMALLVVGIIIWQLIEYRDFRWEDMDDLLIDEDEEDEE